MPSESDWRLSKDQPAKLLPPASDTGRTFQADLADMAQGTTQQSGAYLLEVFRVATYLEEMGGVGTGGDGMSAQFRRHERARVDDVDLGAEKVGHECAHEGEV